MAPSKRLVLASASLRRKSLLTEAGYRFQTIASEVDETLPAGLSPEDAAVEVARRKAMAVLPRARDSVILAADTIVVTPSGEIAGKPLDAADARRMLRALSGSTHVVITGVFIIDASTGQTASEAVSTRVIFGKMTDAEIDAYVDSGEALGKAGAYAIQETGDRFVRRVEGSFTNVVGLPMEVVSRMLKSMHVSAQGGQRCANGG
jgi:septum formation protein